MAEPRKALVGLHGDPVIARSFIRTISSNFKVDQVYDVEAMLAYCARSCYDFYLMDLNFGVEGGLDITSARRVYTLLQQQGVGELERKFIGVSGRDEVVEQAMREGIPAVPKTEFHDRYRELCDSINK